MIKGKERVLIDTNVIIEAHRARCWKAIANRYQLETVKMCLDETQHGKGSRANYIEVSLESVADRVVVHSLEEIERVSAALIPGFEVLDKGEFELMALVVARKERCRICSPDAAVVRLAFQLGLSDQLVSLEELTEASGAKVDFRRNFTKGWQGEFVTRLKLGVL
jgi:hypothetical protein